MQRSHGRWAGVVGLVALVVIAVASIVGQFPPPTRGEDASAADFSAGRALAHVEALAAAPRPPGSVAHAQAREYLLAQLRSWGWPRRPGRGPSRVRR